MKTKRNQTKLTAFIKNLMPDNTENEQKEAENRFIAYLKLVRDIQQRITSEKDKNT